ncbi:AP2-like ethylene-responsive transcription factor At1g16060 [Phoenix dactylifera]|uniref:AP2-like ethylene-responsive transcription factor At1g16060 n=1 Tax=Phoenix dactylifera TaxID=42345 RepID=A0A8B8ZVU6_PHODC|nr:AP2-like ethylene-responsive transcription factor At1g16060 [Phoenix dactylifera]
MDVMLVKSEVNSSGRQLTAMATHPQDSSPTVKRIKRRRREPASPAIAADANGEIIDQPATSSTVKRSSRFRGVSSKRSCRHIWTGRFEAHLWDKGSWNTTQRKKGKQVYLGAYDEEEAAARAYDLAALKYWGPTTITNFPVSDYENEIQIMQNVTKEEYLASIRRHSSGFSRGLSKYRGVARHHHNGRWEARIGRVFGNKYLYLGTYSKHRNFNNSHVLLPLDLQIKTYESTIIVAGTQEEAARAYDIAAIEYRGINAVTNFDLSTYIRWLRPGATNALKITQEQHVNGEAHAVQPPTNLFSSAESETLSHCSPLVAENVISSCKEEFVHHEFPGSSSSSKSSPTALSLLLKSSMFRQLMEKNSRALTEELEEEMKDWKQQMGADIEYQGILYEGIADMPYGYSPDGDNGRRIELQESVSYYDQSEQSIWNGVVSMALLQ